MVYSFLLISCIPPVVGYIMVCYIRRSLLRSSTNYGADISHQNVLTKAEDEVNFEELKDLKSRMTLVYQS